MLQTLGMLSYSRCSLLAGPSNNLCSNKAQLRELESIRTRLLGSRAPLPQTTRGAAAKDKAGKPSLQNVLMAARFIAKMRIPSRAWAKQEVLKKQLVDEIQGQRRAKRSRQLRVVAVGDFSTA